MIEKTLVLLKPDAVQRRLIGEILARFEKTGLKIVGMKMVQADEDIAEIHYKLKDSWVKGVASKTREAYRQKGIELKKTDMEIAKQVQNWLKDYLREGPIVALALEGPNAVEIVRKIVGGTEPKTSLPGTIRGDFSLESYVFADKRSRPVKNLIHASGTLEEADEELAIWFGNNELYNYETDLDKHYKIN